MKGFIENTDVHFFLRSNVPYVQFLDMLNTYPSTENFGLTGYVSPKNLKNVILIRFHISRLHLNNLEDVIKKELMVFKNIINSVSNGKNVFWETLVFVIKIGSSNSMLSFLNDSYYYSEKKTKNSLAEEVSFYELEYQSETEYSMFTPVKENLIEKFGKIACCVSSKLFNEYDESAYYVIPKENMSVLSDKTIKLFDPDLDDLLYFRERQINIITIKL